MFSDVLENYILSKYSMEELGDTHHWEKNGFVVESSEIGAVAVSNWDYEVRLNDDKRRIKIIHPNLLKQILNEFSGLF
jgi:hypothetical protein